MDLAAKTQAEKELEQFVGLSKRLQVTVSIFSVLMMVLAVVMVFPVFTGGPLPFLAHL